MPEGRNADAALHRDTDSYIWTYEECTFVKPNTLKSLVSCKSVILLICPSDIDMLELVLFVLTFSSTLPLSS
jgi:hypothetical protein